MTRLRGRRAFVRMVAAMGGVPEINATLAAGAIVPTPGGELLTNGAAL
jgi:hypothetical protein